MKTKLMGECIRESNVSEPQPLRFCDLEVGDVFRWVENGDADRDDSGLLRQKVSGTQYRYLTTTATATGTAAMVAEMEMEVERYDIEINLHNPCRVRDQ